jgi:hypothetical protein
MTETVKLFKDFWTQMIYDNAQILENIISSMVKYSILMYEVLKVFIIHE